jgi:glycosyltransferase involved in cell wall biosynthesis
MSGFASVGSFGVPTDEKAIPLRRPWMAALGRWGYRGVVATWSGRPVGMTAAYPSRHDDAASRAQGHRQATIGGLRHEERLMAIDVVCLSHLRWDFVYQRPNHLMDRAARDRRVFFVEEPSLHDGPPRLVTRQVRRNLTVATPQLAHGTPHDEAVGAQRAMLSELFTRHAIAKPLLWFCTPMALDHAAHVDATGVVYDCMDELSAFAGAPPRLRERERALFERADIVFTGGESLYEVKRAFHPNVHAFPSSVDAPHFRRARDPRIIEPDDQRSLGHPRLGFFGVVDERMDRDVLVELAAAHADWQVVIVGPVVKIDPATLPRLPNVHYLGHKSYDQLPAYIAGWDVAIMPFAQNDATRFISPTKTLEYLAAGRPVVSTPIRDVVRPYGEEGIVRVAEKGRFASAVEEALDEAGSPEAHARRRAADAVVDRTSWDRTWARMDELVNGAVLGRARAAGPGARSQCTTG